MVGRDDVDGAVAKSPRCRRVCPLPRAAAVHAAAAVVAHDPLIRRADVMRRRFRGHAGRRVPLPRGQAARRLWSKHGEMNALAFRFRNENVARNHDLLSGTGDSRQTELGGNKAFIHHAVADKVLVLAVAHDEQTEMVGILHRQTERFEFDTGCPSSEIAMIPASFILPTSAISTPASPLETAPTG